MNLSRPNVIALVVAAVAVSALGGLAAVEATKSSDDTSARHLRLARADERAAVAVRPDSHRLDSSVASQTPGGDDVQVVEFLDLECPPCAAAQPFVRQLRERFKGRVTFVMRYLPLDMHPQARHAAYAVEAAARQGRLEEMAARLFQTQQQWAGKKECQAPLFRTYARDLGLDLDRYDDDVSSSDVAARVQADVDDAKRLGIQGTPTFLLNGKAIQAPTFDDFARQIDDALDD